MFWQFEHFYRWAGKDVKDPYARKRYRDETRRLMAVLDGRLGDRDYIMGRAYTIVDIATFSWVRSVIRLCEAEEHIGMAAIQNVSSWFARCMERPAVQRGLTVCALDEK